MYCRLQIGVVHICVCAICVCIVELLKLHVYEYSRNYTVIHAFQLNFKKLSIGCKRKRNLQSNHFDSGLKLF